MAKEPKTKETKEHQLLATGGGNATAGGVSFQASVAAFFATHGLAETPMDARLGLGAAKPTEFRFETEVPVDDILIASDAEGWVYIQAKNSLTNSTSLKSELGKTCDEFARLWLVASKGSGALGWDRPLVAGIDAMVIAVGPTASGTIKNALARALDKVREGSAATLTAAQESALNNFRSLLKRALDGRGGSAAGLDADKIIKFVYVLDFDFGGPNRMAAESALAITLNDRTAAPAALATIEKECERRMTARNGIDLTGLRAELSRAGVSINAPADYRADITTLKSRTSKVLGVLKDFEHMTVSGRDITISRDCTKSCISAAKDGSLVVIGDPGTGKSAVINETARQLSAEGSDVVLLAVDRLQVESLEGLSVALGITHPLSDVLANWPGSGPAYLILDALDACRFGRSEALFRSVLQEVLQDKEGRWRIIASIRTFDLIMGRDFGQLFRGVPPSTEFTDLRFQTARHIKVPEWSPTEFEELRKLSPALSVAIDNGGPKLVELAKVPFNTRLLADLLALGIEPEKLRNVRSQVQLLEMYWNERVRPLGIAAELCLSNTVNAMIQKGRMEATRLVAGADAGDALDQLLKQGVLIPVHGDREVAFRHHLLFDYVASRTLIDLNDAAKTEVLLKTSGVSLLLAPALTFALQHLWELSGPRRERFWQIIAQVTGDASTDPIARSVAARVGCDLPSEPADIEGFVQLMTRSDEDELAFAAFRQIIGALSVRIEDEESIPIEPWCAMAEAAARFVSHVAWPLRTLVLNLVDRAATLTLRHQMGAAARAIMEYAFDAENGDMLMPSAIGSVAKTFGSDPHASRHLIERLLEPKRMEEHAPNDMHWLATAMGEISAHDVDLVVLIYDRIFSHVVTDNAPTRMGNSKILPLASNRRQDFEMSQWGLKEAFPSFAEKHLLAAAQVAIRVSQSHIRNNHSLTEPTETLMITTGGHVGHITEDYSHIWAASHRGQYSDNAEQIINVFVEQLMKVSDEDAIEIANTLIAENDLGWLWNRLLMVANERGGALAAELWPWVAQTPLLRSPDTRKPATALLASQYKLRSSTEKQALEERVLAESFPTSSKPDDAALNFRRRIFFAIGTDALETNAARDVVDVANSTGNVILSDDGHVDFDDEFVDTEEYYWLRDQGVDIDSEPNRSVVAAIAACENAFQAEDSATESVSDAVRTLCNLLDTGDAVVHPIAAAHGWEKGAWALEKVTEKWSSVQSFSALQQAELEDLIKSIRSALKRHSAVNEDLYLSANMHMAGAIMNIVRRSSETTERFSDDICAFARDTSPDVRDEIARRLSFLWTTNRTLLWDLVKKFANTETAPRVLVRLIHFLLLASNDETDLVGETTQTILSRNDVEVVDGRDIFHENLGTLVFHLWIRHRQPAALQTIELWLKNRSTFKAELHHGAFSIRENLVVGYDNNNALDRETRIRCQELAFKIIDKSASGLENYIALDDTARSEARQAEATNDAGLLNEMSAQFYFAVGASEIRSEEKPLHLESREDRKRYIKDNEITFRRIGDIATPATIHYLIQLLDFLAPGDPALVFDLVTHALLKAGKFHGYQFESLGADQFVDMIAQSIADHRVLFDDPARRLTLVEVLEVFVDAGWTSARRLLYRLPEALR